MKRWKKLLKNKLLFIIFLFFIIVIFSPSIELEDISLSALLSVSEKSEVGIENFSMNDYEFYTTDEGIEFYTKVLNKGNKIETIISEITILYFYNDSIAKIIELPNSTLLGGEEQVQIIPFNHSDLLPSKYSAIFSIEYNGTKKNSTLYFTIANPPSTQKIPSGMSSLSGGVAFIGTRPSFLDKKIEFGTSGKVFTIVGGTSFSEVYKNERGFLLASIKNEVKEPKIISIDYPTTNIFRFNGPKEIVLEPFQVAKFLLPFDVKKEEKSGYYLVELKFIWGNQTQSQKCLINLKEEDFKPVQFKRNIIWNNQDNTTNVYLELKNNLDKKIDYLEIYESIPSKIFNNISFDFFPSNSKTQKNKNEVWFGFKELRPNETQVIEYKLNSLIIDPELYLNWRVSNLLLHKEIKGDLYSNMKKIYLQEVFIPQLQPGERKILKFDVFNNDYLKKEIKINFIPPYGWSSSKQFISFVLYPREVQRIEIMLSVPENIAQGKYSGMVYLEYDKESEEKEIKLEVKNPNYGMFIQIKEPFEIQFIELQNQLSKSLWLIIFIVIIILISLILYLSKRKEFEDKIKSKSINQLIEIKEILLQNKNSKNKP